jgi:WD40 repeat protein
MAAIGPNVISAGYDRQLIWWDAESRTPAKTIVAHDRWIRRLIQFPGGKHIATIADDMLCKVWDVETTELVAAFTDHRPLTPEKYPSMLYACTISADGRYLATADKVGHVVIWNTESFEKVGEVETPLMYTWDAKQRHHSIGGVRSLAFSPDGKQLAVGGIGTIGNIDHLGGPARLEVFQWQSGERLFVCEDEKLKGLIEQVFWLPQDKILLTAGGDNKGFVTCWNSENGQLLEQAAVNGHVHGFTLDPITGEMTIAGHEQITRWSIWAEN